jgi:nicotinamide riboside kinase
MKIAIVGPESSGKTTLVEALMFHYMGGMVSEVAREYLGELDRPYEEHDLLEMARSHWELHGGSDEWIKEHEAAIGMVEARQIKKIRTKVFYDNDLLNFKIWSQEKYGRVHPEIERMAAVDLYDYRFLCRPDIPWVPDPQRENPHDRDRLFTIWERELKAHGFPYTIIEGPTREERLRKATNMVDVLIEGEGMRDR